MTITRTVKTNFTSGQVLPQLIGRGDLRAYDNGAQKLQNIFIYPTGGVTRRAGLAYLATLPGAGRLAALEFNTDQTYLLVFTDNLISIFLGGVPVTTLATPWTAAQLAQINWAQSADTLLVVHPDVPPQKITRTNTGWTLAAWSFEVASNITYQPYHKFADTLVTVTPSATTGTITLTASAGVFDASHAGTRMRVGGKEVQITTYSSPTVLNATVIQTLSGTAATVDWQEQAFSAVRGWPTSVTFHQGRLVIGGSRDLPNLLWLSKSNNLFNFNLGTGLDDESIQFTILSDQVNAIRAVVSARDLLVFTSGAEWMVSGAPLTPSSIQLKRQTRVGSLTTRTAPPVDVDGATLFISRTGKEVREFIFNYSEDAYTATDVALLASNMIVDPREIAFDKIRKLLFLVRGDGTFATLTLYRAESVVAWTEHQTAGSVISIAIAGDNTYALVARGSQFFLEQFTDGLALDAALSGTAVVATTHWGGLGYLSGQTVSIVADGTVVADQTVSAGTITLAAAANNVTAGLPFTHTIQPLPPNAVGTDGAGRAARLIEAQFRLQNTSAFTVDTGMGAAAIPLRMGVNETTIGAPPPVFTGDLSVRGTGWRKDLTQPLWTITGAVPLPFTLLSVTNTISLN